MAGCWEQILAVEMREIGPMSAGSETSLYGWNIAVDFEVTEVHSSRVFGAKAVIIYPFSGE